MLKRIFFQIHWFLGITAGLILSLMGITGAIYSYDQQILKALNSESYVVVAQEQPKLTPAQLYQHFQQQDPELKINSITIAKDPTSSSTVNIVKEGERRGKNMMVNPYTAEVLPDIKGQKFFAFIQQLHRNLTVGPVGKQITGACTLILIFFVLSGLYLRWPKKHSARQWLAIKPKLKGRNFIWDLHAVVGTWVIVFYLIFAITGLTWSYQWWRSGLATVLGVQQSQQQGPRPEGQANEARNPRGEGQGMNTEGRSARAEGQQMRGEERGPSADGQSMNAKNRSPRGENQGMGNAREQDASLAPEQISAALTATWAGFNQQAKYDYSTLTLTLPKNDQGEIKLSFVDPIPQHERARNSATYNYKDNQIIEVELYEDKKLNQKIMSSLLPVHRGSFMGPIYQFVAMLASLAMPLFFVTGWMLYLKRRKQKALTLNARSSSAAQIDPNAEKWTIFYASQTGTAEQIAYNTSTSLQQAGLATEVKALKDINLEQLQKIERALFVVSTYGTGDAPDLATNFVKKQLTQSGNLSQLQYAVLALGSKEYPETYCTFGHVLNEWLANNSAQAVFDVIEVDNGSKQDVASWFNKLSTLTNTEIHAVISEKVYDDWQLTARELLNPNSLGEPAFTITLKPKADESWHAGDIAEIQPGNSEKELENFYAQHQLTATPELTATLRFKNLREVTQIDANSNAWIEQLNDLPSREYSIASIPQEGQLQLVVRQAQQNGELGLGSGWLTAYANINTALPMRIRTNPSFHLIDDNRPIILIGNGTGIAGLLSLIKQRAALGLKQNWLIFGERQQSTDFFFQSEIQAWQANGTLSHVDLAFSRDQAERIYVQSKLLEQRDRLKEWIAQGAVIYVCGSIEGMATGVDQALHEILGEETINQLHENDRYRRDVY